MHHVVNFGLLFSFLTLAVSGILGFLKPFSTATTRVHIVFGVATLILVGCHLAARLPYFKRTLSGHQGRRPTRAPILGIAVLWMVLLAFAIQGWSPAAELIELGYESRNRAAIVRSSPLTGIAHTPQSLDVVRQPEEPANVALSFTVQLKADLSEGPAIAVWAETSSGSMIETLYLSPELAYSDEPTWAGQATRRNEILPIWRHRHTLVSGVNAKGEVDAVSGATKSHRFTLDKYLLVGEDKSFVLCLELNLPRDPNDTYQEAQIGQPSLLYTAYIEPQQKQNYVLLELTGHGGGAEDSGAIQYDLEGFTSALEIVDLLLAKIEYLEQKEPSNKAD